MVALHSPMAPQDKALRQQIASLVKQRRLGLITMAEYINFCEGVMGGGPRDPSLIEAGVEDESMEPVQEEEANGEEEESIAPEPTGPPDVTIGTKTTISVNVASSEFWKQLKQPSAAAIDKERKI